MSDESAEPHMSHRRTILVVVVPFLVLGIGDFSVLIAMGVDPVWGFIILPPMVFVIVLGWLAFRSGLGKGRLDDPDDVA